MPYLLYNDIFREQEYFRNGDYKDLKKLINYLIESSEIFDTVIIVPTRRIVRYLNREITKHYFKLYDKPIKKLKLYNLEDFTLTIFRELFNLKSLNENKENSPKYPKIISESLRLVLFEEAFVKSNLKYFKFSKSKVKLEIIRKLSDLVYGVREDGFSTKNALKELEQDIDSKFEVTDEKKNSDILNLIINYEKLLQKDLFDLPKIYDYINTEFSNLNENREVFLRFFNNCFGKNSQIIAFGFSDFKEPEVNLLSRFQYIDIPFGIYLDYSDTNGPLFGNFQEVIQKFILSGYNIFSDDILFNDINQDINERNSFFLRKHLFNYSSDVINIDFESYVKIFEMNNFEDEIKSIAKLVKYLNIKKGINFEDIAIVSRRPEDYSEGFAEIFRKEKIPVNITDRKNLWSSGIVNIILSLIEISFEFKLELLNNIINSKLIKLDQEVDAKNILKVSNLLKLKSFYYNIKSQYILEKAKQFKSYILDKLNEKELDHHEEKRLKTTEIELSKFINDFEYVSKTFVQNNKELSADEFYKFVQELINKYGVAQCLKQNIKDYSATINNDNLFDVISKLEDLETENNALEKFLDLIKELTQTFSMRFGKQKFSLKVWLERIKIAISAERYQISEKYKYGVFISSIEQLRMMPFKVKIFCGLNDGVFPTIYSSEQMLGKELKDAKQRHYRSEKVSFYQFMSNSNLFLDNSKPIIYLSYINFKNGEKQSPSPFIENLIKISNLKPILKSSNIEKNDEAYEELIWMNSITKENELLNLLLKDNRLFGKDIRTEYSDNLINPNFIKEFNYLSSLDKKFLTQDKLILDELIKDKILNKQYSINDLEMYAKCPFKYFTKNFLDIEQPSDEKEEFSNLDKGTFLHTILYKFYDYLLKTKHSTKNIGLIGNDGNNFQIEVVELSQIHREFYQKLLLELVKEELKNPVYEHPFIQLETKDFKTKDAIHNNILKWLDYELEKISNGWKFYPFAFEINLFEVIKTEEPDRINQQMQFHIKADKVEIAQLEGANYFAVVDYKLSENSLMKNKDIIKDFISFQMPMYLVVLKEYFKKMKIRINPAFGIYNYFLSSKPDTNFNLKFVLLSNPELLPEIMRKKSSTPTQLLKGKTTGEAINNSLNKAFEIREEILSGNFPFFENISKNCNSCKYDPLCRRRDNN